MGRATEDNDPPLSPLLTAPDIDDLIDRYTLEIGITTDPIDREQIVLLIAQHKNLRERLTQNK